MKNSNPIQTTTIVIPAGTPSSPGVANSQIGGELFGCVVASQPFRMAFDAGGQFDVIQGAVVPVPGGFKGMTFFNVTAAEIVIQIFVGVAGINIIPTNAVKVFPTYPKGTDLKGASALGAGAKKDFSGLDGLNLRKQFTVQNLDNGGNYLEVLDSNGNALGSVAPNSPPWTHETGGLISVKNVGGAALSRVLVCEIFYAS